jgi:iron(III) transport system substrate-binding protein
MLTRKYGWEFYRKLKANDIMIVQGHQQVSDALTRGERAIAAEGSDSYAWNDRKEGHKIFTVFPTEGAFLVPSPSAVVKGGPHPHAAKALAEFLLSDEVQNLLPDEGIYAARSDIRPPAGNPPLGELTFLPIDFDYVEAEAATIKNRFNEIFQ